MSAYSTNRYNTTLLVLNVMDRCAHHLDLDIEQDFVADKLYNVCCDLEHYPEDCGFGSSDQFSYNERAEREFAFDSMFTDTNEMLANLSIIK